MPPHIVALLALAAIVAAFITTIIVRAILFVPYKKDLGKPALVAVDTEKAVHDLGEMIKCRTVSHTDRSLDDDAEFDRFEALLPTLFPAVFEKCKYEKVSDRALLIKWEGKSHDNPTVLMAHYDVVSVEESKWSKPAFDAVIENGVLWGRGTLDTKGTLNGILQAAEQLISEKFVPERDVYFAFGGDEEVNGHGAPDIVKLFTERGIAPGIVVDEGGAVVSGAFPGVKENTALIGIAEKGMVNVEYSVEGIGGHASSPKPHTPVGILSAACVKVESHPFKYNLSVAAEKLFDNVCRHSTFLYRIIFANLWCFAPVLNLIGKLSGGELNAMMRTTTAFTQMEGSQGANVIPPYSRMVSNHRIAEGETPESVVERITKIVGDDRVKIRALSSFDPSPTSSTECEAWDRLSAAVGETWQDAIVSPYYMLACSDSRHWSRVSDKVYRFSAMYLSKEERATIHGNDERIKFDTVAKTVEFYVRLMKKS